MSPQVTPSYVTSTYTNRLPCCVSPQVTPYVTSTYTNRLPCCVSPQVTPYVTSTYTNRLPCCVSPQVTPSYVTSTYTNRLPCCVSPQVTPYVTSTYTNRLPCWVSPQVTPSDVTSTYTNRLPCWVSPQVTPSYVTSTYTNRPCLRRVPTFASGAGPVVSSWGRLFHSGIALRNSKNGKFLDSAVSSPQDCSKCFTRYFPDRPVYSGTNLASLRSIQPYATINAQRLLVHISTTVYSQVLIQLSELEQCRVKKLAHVFVA